MTMTRTVIVDTAAHKELKVLAVRFVKAIVAAIDELDVTTKHRHAMTGVYVPHWQVEVGDHRVYYVFDADTVTVKAVRLKGNKRTEEVFKP